MSPPPEIITFDVEEWFHGHNYLKVVPRERWDEQKSRVVGNTELCLEILARHGVRATFFVLGWTAERHPDLVRRIAAAGHEIACHSYAHPLVFELEPEQFAADLDRAVVAIAATGVGAVAGYRAPSFTLTPPVHAYLELLRARGFRYDCSLFPVRHPRYGQRRSPRQPFLLEGAAGAQPFTVVPMTVARLARTNLPFSGGGYLRLLPLRAYRALRAVARRQGVATILYVHPWELDSFRPEAGLGWLTRIRSQGGQSSMPHKLGEILSESRGRFQTMGEYVSGLLAAGALPRRSLPLV